jgi:hypothetical protein
VGYIGGLTIAEEGDGPLSPVCATPKSRGAGQPRWERRNGRPTDAARVSLPTRASMATPTSRGRSGVCGGNPDGPRLAGCLGATAIAATFLRVREPPRDSRVVTCTAGVAPRNPPVHFSTP